MQPHKQFFGDRTRSFALDPVLIAELERTTATGIGGLCRHLFAGEFRHHEMREVIRLALIGGGESPEDAASLVSVYVDQRPIEESYALAVAILEAAWFGAPKIEGGISLGDPQPEDAADA